MNKLAIIVVLSICSLLYSCQARTVYFSDGGNSNDLTDFPAGARRADNLAPIARPLPDGYYQVDGGRIKVIPISSNQRQDLPQGTRFTPIVKYKQTHTKRKRLFVPNFFG